MSMTGARGPNHGNRILPSWGCKLLNGMQRLTGEMPGWTPKEKNGKGNWKEAKYVCVTEGHSYHNAPPRASMALPGKPLDREAVTRISTKQTQKKSLCQALMVAKAASPEPHLMGGN